jgi:hypothetical protein
VRIGFLNLLKENNKLRASNSMLERRNELLKNFHKKEYQKAKSMSETHAYLDRKIR